MTTPFSRTLRALEAERAHAMFWGTVFVSGLGLTWILWLLLARVSLYETTTVARLEAGRAGHVVQAPFPSRVAASYLTLDKQVAAGETLIELDSDSERLALAVERARLGTHAEQIKALQREINAQQQALGAERQATTASLDVARSEASAATPLSRYAEEEIQRLKGLHDAGLVSDLDFMKRTAEVERARFDEKSAALAVTRVGAEMRTRETDRLAQIEKLRHDMQVLEGERITSTAEVTRLEHEVERRRIVAPVAGRVGNIAVLRAGSFVDEGTLLATVVPEGEVRAVAEFPAARSLGRIHQGQRARLRLEGFPWGQYGSLKGTVDRVATESQQGTVRVELLVSRDGSLIPELQHGLQASVDVEVERVRPAVLLMRVLGRLGGSAPAPQPQSR